MDELTLLKQEILKERFANTLQDYKNGTIAKEAKRLLAARKRAREMETAAPQNALRLQKYATAIICAEEAKKLSLAEKARLLKLRIFGGGDYYQYIKDENLKEKCCIQDFNLKVNALLGCIYALIYVAAAVCSFSTVLTEKSTIAGDMGTFKAACLLYAIPPLNSLMMLLLQQTHFSYRLAFVLSLPYWGWYLFLWLATPYQFPSSDWLFILLLSHILESLAALLITAIVLVISIICKWNIFDN